MNNLKQKELNIVFLGDSLYQAQFVTESHKFVTQVGEWFKKQYETETTKVNYYNKGAGGTSTEYSLARVVRDVINLNPDVVFFGTTVNDGLRNTTRNMESVIRTLQAMENPPYIIMTRFPEVIFEGGVPSYGKALADHYGIPFIDATEAFQKAVANGVVMKDLFMDFTHPNDDGHDILAAAIIEKLAGGKCFVKGSNKTPKLLALSGEIAPESADSFSALDKRVIKSAGWTENTDNPETVNSIETASFGETLQFQFTGNILAFTYGMHKEAAHMEVWVDGRLMFFCDPYHGMIEEFRGNGVCKETSSYFDLSDGEHTVEMKVVKSKNANVTAPVQKFRIYNILTASWAK